MAEPTTKQTAPGPGGPRESSLTRASNLIRTVVQAFSAFLFILFTGVILVQVVLRYFTNGSLIWSEEFVRYTLVWCMLIASAAVTDSNEHLKIDSVASYLTPRGRRIQDGIVQALNIIFLSILFWQGLKLMERVTFSVSATMRIPMRYVYMAMPVGAALMIIVSLLLLARLIKGEEIAAHTGREEEDLT